MKNIVIIGDSLACPRPWIGLGQDETYASRIQRRLGESVHVINLAHGERSTRYYASDTFTNTYIQQSNTNTLIMQLGIVDCAPRLMTFAERAVGFLCSKNKVLNALFTKYVAFKSRRRLFFTKVFPNIMVKKDEFENNVRSIINNYMKHCEIHKIFLINIAFPGTYLTERSYNVLPIIESYNDTFARIQSENPALIQVLDLFSITREDQSLITQEDGHHITKRAHEILEHKLLERLTL